MPILLQLGRQKFCSARLLVGGNSELQKITTLPTCVSTFYRRDYAPSFVCTNLVFFCNEGMAMCCLISCLIKKSYDFSICLILKSLNQLSFSLEFYLSLIVDRKNSCICHGPNSRIKLHKSAKIM